jgi:CBS domain containing-hemolysin-like protein
MLIAVTLTVMAVAQALYVAAEFATVSLRRAHIRQKATSGNRFAQLLEPFLSDTTQLDRFIATCQFGATLATLLLGFYAQAAIATSLGGWLSSLGIPHPLLAHLLSFFIVLIWLVLQSSVIGELVPRSLAVRHAEWVALILVIPLRWSMTFFHPVITLFNKIATIFLRLVGIEAASHRGHALSPEELEVLAMESARRGLLEADERQLLHNVFRVGELTAAKVMVPRVRLVAAPVDMPIPSLLELATSSGHTRIPIYRNTIDNIVGSVHLKDLFRLYTHNQHDVSSIMRKICYAPENRPALAVWNQLQQESCYIAVVLDEFGGTAGMITVADLLEEIFGELRDEFDNGPALIARGKGGCARVHGEVLIADVNEWFGVHLPEEEVNTIGGLAMAELGRPPRVGDVVSFGPTTLMVQGVEGSAVTEVCVFPDSPPDTRSHPFVSAHKPQDQKSSTLDT